MYKLKFDLKDRKILYELNKNCRQSNSQIAKKVGLTKQVVNYRIKVLEKKGVIKKYVAQLNLPEMGFLSYKVMIQIQNANPEKEKEIINHIKTNKNVHWIVSCFGRWDIIFSISSKTVMDFSSILSSILKKFDSFIKEKEILLLMDLHQFSRNYLTEETVKEEMHFGGKPKEVKLDKTDLDIMKILSENARENIVTIAKHLNTTIDIIRYRIKKMVEKKIIQSFNAVIDRSKLGYQYWNILLKTKDLTNTEENKIISFLKEIPNILFVSKYMDDYNLGFELEVENIEKMNEILLNFRYNFSDMITSYETTLFFEEYKFDFIPF